MSRSWVNWASSSSYYSSNPPSLPTSSSCHFQMHLQESRAWVVSSLPPTTPKPPFLSPPPLLVIARSTTGESCANWGNSNNDECLLLSYRLIGISPRVISQVTCSGVYFCGLQGIILFLLFFLWLILTSIEIKWALSDFTFYSFKQFFFINNKKNRFQFLKKKFFVT